MGPLRSPVGSEAEEEEHNQSSSSEEEEDKDKTKPNGTPTNRVKRTKKTLERLPRLSSDSEVEDDYASEESSAVSEPVAKKKPTLTPAVVSSPNSVLNHSALLSIMKKVFLTVLTFAIMLTSFSPFVTNNLGLTLGLSLQVRNAPIPSPFFPNSLWVDDYYDGDIYSAFAEANQHRNAFFMYYAPWDADSQFASSIFDQLASTFEDNGDLYIAAVNCWTADGECYSDFGAGNKKTGGRQRASIQNQFPVFVFYPKDRRGIQYVGPITLAHIMEFVQNCIRPLDVVSTEEEVLRARAMGGGRALLAHFEPMKGWRPNTGYEKFLQASYDLLEIDPFRTQIGRPAVVLSPSLAFSLHLNTTHSPLRLSLPNGTAIAFPNKTISASDSVVNWAAGKAALDEHLTSWAGTSGRKSARLGQLLSGGSALLVFMPRAREDVSPGVVNEELALLREAAVEYKSCINDAKRLNGPLSRTFRHLRQMSPLELESELNRCLRDPWFKDFCSTQEQPSDSCACAMAVDDSMITGNRSGVMSTVAAQRKISEMDPTLFFRQQGGWGRSGVSDVNVHNEQVSWRRHRCGLLTTSQDVCSFMPCNMEFPPFPSEEPGSEDIKISSPFSKLTGLGCADNRTLSFHSLDWDTQAALAESIGLKATKARGNSNRKPIAVIVEEKTENVFFMEEEFNSEALSEFVQKFHQEPDSLRRLKRSKIIYPPKRPSAATKENVLALPEINAATFLPSLFSSEEEYTVLLYTSPSCGACSSVAHMFHAVSKLLSSERLRFATVDAAKNDLPWHFTALSVPSVLFLGGDQETRAFPSEKAVSVPNLVSFVVANLPEELRLDLSIKMCDSECVEKAMDEAEKRRVQDEEHSAHYTQMGDILRTEQLRRQRLQEEQKPLSREAPVASETLLGGQEGLSSKVSASATGRRAVKVMEEIYKL